jgi:hypothetical protein
MAFKVKDLVIRLEASGCGQCTQTQDDADNCTTTPPTGEPEYRRDEARTLALAALRSQLRSSLDAPRAV